MAVTAADVVELVTQLVANRAGLSNHEQVLPPDTRLNDIGLDSLKIVDLIVDIEAAFCLVLPDDLLNIQTFESIRSIADAVARPLAASQASSAASVRTARAPLLPGPPPVA